jgi:hypothetical protein
VTETNSSTDYLAIEGHGRNGVLGRGSWGGGLFMDTNDNLLFNNNPNATRQAEPGPDANHESVVKSRKSKCLSLPADASGNVVFVPEST